MNPRDETRVDERQLLAGRVPTTMPVLLPKRGGAASLREGWLPRHTVVMVVATPLLVLGYLSTLDASLSSTWALVIGALGLLGALVVTTYVPLRGAGVGAASSCALMAGIAVPMSFVVVDGATSVTSGVLALGIVAMALAQRLSGTSACR